MAWACVVLVLAALVRCRPAGRRVKGLRRDARIVVEPSVLEFAGLLRQLRAQAGLTQEELAEAAGLSPRSVSDLERGINRTARKDTALLLAGALGLAEQVRGLFVAAARGRGAAAEVLAAGRRVARDAPVATGNMHGFPAALTSFVGRAGPLREVAGLLCDRRLVTVTGPGGAGKTRLAAQVARLVTGRFADGAWLAEAATAEAVALFADRACHADAHFTLDEQTVPAVARLVSRLDGMPLAIELAAAQVETLGVTGLLGRLDGRLALLAGADRLAPPRQRSLAAAVGWSYQLLDEAGRRVFRAVSVFPAGFTLEGAEAVAGQAASPAVLRLVDCSLLTPPRDGPDGRPRYVMLETLRGYGAGRLAEAGEQDQAAAALAGYALEVAEKAAPGLQTRTGEREAARWLDAEDATMRQVLAWAMGHDPQVALRLAIALGWWWYLRGRLAGQRPLLAEVTGYAEPGSDRWCTAQFYLGWAAEFSADMAGAVEHFTTLRDAVAGRPPSPPLADALAGRSYALRDLGQFAEAAEDARRALAVAREVGHPLGEVLALQHVALAAAAVGEVGEAVRLARQAGEVRGDIPASIARTCSLWLTEVLLQADDFAAAERVCADGLAASRDAGDLANQQSLLARMAELDLQAGRTGDAAVHLREAAAA